MGMFLNISHWDEVFDKETLCHLIYVFILVLELLSAAIKNDPEITGILSIYLVNMLMTPH
jgi:hypothetical protein